MAKQFGQEGRKGPAHILSIYRVRLAMASHIVCITTLLSQSSSLMKHLFYTHFREEEVKAQPGSVSVQAQAGLTPACVSFLLSDCFPCSLSLNLCAQRLPPLLVLAAVTRALTHAHPVAHVLPSSHAARWVHTCSPALMGSPNGQP